MNRTGIFLATAGGLALVAIAMGLPPAAPTPPHPPPVIPVPPPPFPQPAVSSDGSIKMTGRLSHTFLAPGQADLFVTVDLQGVDLPGAARAPVNLAVVIDRSGSMSGYKLEQAKMAAQKLVAQLGDADRLAIVHYGSEVKHLPSLEATAENKARMQMYIDQIWDDGGTNIGAGLTRGRDQLVRALADYQVNRLILISDGQPTEGVTSHAGLTQVVRSLRQRGISVSSIGVGTDFNEDLMQGLAESGRGAYAYLQDAAQLATIFQKDLQQAGTLVGRDVLLTFELPSQVMLGEVLGYPAVQSGSQVQIRLTDFSASQHERVVARLRVQVPEAGRSLEVTSLRLTYQDLLQHTAVASAAGLTAMSTHDAQQILEGRDKEATVFAARAVSAGNMHRAAEALKRGDRRTAQDLLKKNDSVFDEAAAVAGAAAVEEDRKDQAIVYGEVTTATEPQEVQQAVKASKSKALRGYGRIGSTY